MTSSSKIVAGSNPLIFLVLLVPVLVFAKPAYDSYRRLSNGVTRSDENYYYVYTALGWRAYRREAIDQADYSASVELAKNFARDQQRLLYFLSASGALFLLVALFFRFTTKIELSGDTIAIRSPMLLKKDIVDVNSIRSLQAVTAVPLIRACTDISQVSWGDNIVISEEGGQMAVSLFVFPGFRRIVNEVLAKRPEIKVSFFKTTMRGNLARFRESLFARLRRRPRN